MVFDAFSSKLKTLILYLSTVYNYYLKGERKTTKKPILRKTTTKIEFLSKKTLRPNFLAPPLFFFKKLLFDIKKCHVLG
jgi:hypothetical protein